MKSNWFIFCFAFLNVSTFAQNPSYALFGDSIFPIAETNYEKAKHIFGKYESAYLYDPTNILAFLQYSLEKNDTSFFKKQIQKLIRDYGYNFLYSDTVLVSYESYDHFKHAIHEKGLSEWTVSAVKENLPIWVKNHPENIAFEGIKEKLYIKDQLTREFFWQVREEGLSLAHEDSLLHAKLRNKISEQFYANDLQNIYFIREVIKRNGNKLPTNFDCLYLSNYIELVVFHNMKAFVNLKMTWQILHQYFEEAYLQGTIGMGFFSMYDKYLFESTGKQYYGTLGNEIPADDSKALLRRKELYKF